MYIVAQRRNLKQRTFQDLFRNKAAVTLVPVHSSFHLEHFKMSLQTVVTTSRLVAAFVYCSLSTDELYAFISVNKLSELDNFS